MEGVSCLKNPFCHNVDETELEKLPDVSTLWMSYVVIKNGVPEDVSAVFYANIWPEFWPHVTKKASARLKSILIETLRTDSRFKTYNLEFWLLETSKLISHFIKWDQEFFRCFPWTWLGLNKKTLKRIAEESMRTPVNNVDEWFKEPKTKHQLSPRMQSIVDEAMKSMYTENNKTLTNVKLQEIEEDNLSDSDKFALRSLKLKFHALREKEIPKLKALSKATKCFKWIKNNGGELYPDDYQFNFRLGCDDSKSTQWQAIMRYKGFVGELIFQNDYDSIIQEIPENLKMIDGVKTLPDELNFTYVPECEKPSIFKIIKMVEDEYDIEINQPAIVPMYYPDFFIHCENANVVTLTLFENTFSTLTSVKTKNDEEKWKAYIKYINSHNGSLERNEIEYHDKVFRINLVTVNVKQYMQRVHGDKFIQTRITLINELIQHYNQFKLSHENTSILSTIRACQQLRMPNRVETMYSVDKEVLDDLTHKVNEDVKKDYNLDGYVQKLEEQLSKDDREDFEENLIRLLREKVVLNKMHLNQEKWVETNKDNILDGILSIENNLFDHERILRMVENNHHDQTQFCTLSEGTDLSSCMQDVFDKYSDLLALFNDPKVAKLKPTLCMMIHCAAGHTMYVANTMQFGSCKGLNHKNSRINQMMKIINKSKIKDIRVESLNSYHQTGKPSPKAWNFGKYSIEKFKTDIEPHLIMLSIKKEKADFNYRYTTSDKCKLVNQHNYNLVENVCCSDQLFRFEHSANDIWATCPSHKTRFKIIDPFCQLKQLLEQTKDPNNQEEIKQNYSYKETVQMLFELAKKKGTNVFLTSHIAHFLSGCLSNKKLVKHVIPLFPLCHSFYKNEIVLTLSKRFLKKETIKAFEAAGISIKQGLLTNDKMTIDAKLIAQKWYKDNTKYIQDKVSANNLVAEINAVCETNPFSFCLAEFAELLIKSRSQYFCLQNSIGYVTFSRTFGPVYSSPTSADSESVKCFSGGNGHFFINHRTLRMMQALPLMLISNKLIVDQMSSRDFVAGNYSQDALVQFCLLNSRRLNVNLQNIRYFFMCCWSKFHSPFLFKKLEMDFLKVSELNVSRAIIKFMKQVWRNYVFLNRKEENLDDDSDDEYPDNMEPKKDFSVLFNKTVKADLNHVDLCLHSFYMVHLFEKTIPGKVQEIKKVFKKFLKPKLKWKNDSNKYKAGILKEKEKSRFLMSDGLNDNLEECVDNVIEDCLKHENKYAGFNLDFIKCAAQNYNSYSKNEFETEIRVPHPVSELLKSTSTVRKFNPMVNFQNLCESVDLKKNVDVAMKQLDNELVQKLLDKTQVDDIKVTLFPKCLEKMNNIKHTPAIDMTENERDEFIKFLEDFNLAELNNDYMTKLDERISESRLIQICENYNEDCFKFKTDSEKIKEMSELYWKNFPNVHQVLCNKPELSLLLFMDQLKFDKDLIVDVWNQTRIEKGQIITTDIDRTWAIACCRTFEENPDEIINKTLSCINKDRTPRNRILKRQVQGIVSKYANPREMTTRLINEILNLMNKEVFADTYSVCHNFKFNCDPVVFGMAFKEQFGGERELTIGDIWSKLTLKLQEDICRHLGKCMDNSCLNEPKNEEIFKELIIKNQSSNQIVLTTDKIGHSSAPLYGSIDRSKWGPYHQGLSFYTVLNILIMNSRGESDDIRDLVKYSSLKHALKKFEIHHNVIFSIILKGIRKGMICKQENKWVITDNDVRPDIKMEDWEMFTLTELESGKKHIHTRMDMGQGMLHSSSDVYGAVVDDYIKKIIKKFVSETYNGVTLIYESMNTSDDRSTLLRICGKDLTAEKHNEIFRLCILLEDILQRLGNMYISEKSVWSKIINEFKSAFMKNGVEVRVLVKFLSSQLTIGKDCFPEDFWNTYNSLTKQLLNNGGSQMMCDLLYLSKLHQLQTLYTFSKSPFKDCVADATPARFGFPNLSAVDIYYHTSQHIMASRTVKFLHSVGIQAGVLTVRSSDNVQVKTKRKKQKTVRFRITDKTHLPFEFITHTNTTVFTEFNEGLGKYITKVTLSEASRPFYLHHKTTFTLHDFQENLVKFYTLSKSPGFMDNESLCGGVNTVLPSMKGKKTDKDVVTYRGLKDLDYLDYFIMSCKQNTQECAKIRGNQALYQAVKQEAKKSHQNMVFAKGLLINKGKFCFFGKEMVTQEFAMNNFNCEDLEFKSISNLIWKLADNYAPISRILKRVYTQKDSSYEINIKNSVTTHKEIPIEFHMDPSIMLKHKTFTVRAYMRSQNKETNLKDDYILANDNITAIDIDSDVIKFKKYYSNFTDTELMLTDMNKHKSVLAGVYMFDQSANLSAQIGLILQGCIHNNLTRKVDIETIAIKDSEIDTQSIYRALTMVSIWCTGGFSREEMKNKLIDLMIKKPEVGAAIMGSINDSELGKICATLVLLTDSEHEGAKRVLLDKFKDFKNVSERSTMVKRVISGICTGVSFVMTIHHDDSMNISLKVSMCDDRAINSVQRKIRHAFGFMNENFIITVDKDMPSETYNKFSMSRNLVVDYRRGKFVMIMSDSSFNVNIDYFMEADNDETRIAKWNNCVELDTVIPPVTDYATLWNLIKTDEQFEKLIDETDLSTLSLDVYQEQFNALKLRIQNLPHPCSNTLLMSNVQDGVTSKVVIRDLMFDDKEVFKSICPEFLTCRNNPFVQTLFVCKLICNASKLDDVFTAINVLETIEKYQHTIPELPAIKFHGHQVTNIGVIGNGNSNMNPCTEFNTNNKTLSLKSDQLQRHFGPNIGENTILIFTKEVSMESLFAFQASNSDVCVQIIDIETEDFIYIDLKNRGDNCSFANELIAKKHNYRPALMVAGGKKSSKRLVMEL